MKALLYCNECECWEMHTIEENGVEAICTTCQTKQRPWKNEGTPKIPSLPSLQDENEVPKTNHKV